MRKIIKINFLLAIMAISLISIFSITNVNAAYAYSWTIDGEIISRGSSNKSGTASWAEDSNYDGSVLTLNNYNGGQLKIECRGTGLGHVFAVKLVGNNTITAENGVGIIANEPIVFIGDGKLTIKAAIPIGSGDIKNNDSTLTEIEKANFNSSTTITIEPSVEKVKESSNNDSETIKDNSNSSNNEKTTTEKDNELTIRRQNKTSFLDSDLFKTLSLTYCAISLIVIIVLIIKLVTKK